MSIGRNTLAASPDATTLQYASGITRGRRSASGNFGLHIGFHVEVGKNPDVDEAMKQAKVPQMEIKHQQGGVRVIRHWDLTFGKDEGWVLPIYVVSRGPVQRTVAASLAGKYARLTAEAGIGLRWGQNAKSKAAVYCYLLPLVRVGFLGPFKLTVTGKMTDEGLMKSLVDHTRACEMVDKLVRANRPDQIVEFHEVALPLCAGTEQAWGKGQNVSQVTPFKSAHPAALDADYLRPFWRHDRLHQAASELFPSLPSWALEFQQTGDEDDGQPHEEREAVSEEAL